MQKFITEMEKRFNGDFNSFTRKFKNAVKRTFPNATLTGFKPNHYCFSGFIEEEGEKTVYVSFSTMAGMPLDLRASNARGILVRVAENTKDYTGGFNNFCSFYDFKNKVEQVRKWGR